MSRPGSKSRRCAGASPASACGRGAARLGAARRRRGAVADADLQLAVVRLRRAGARLRPCGAADAAGRRGHAGARRRCAGGAVLGLSGVLRDPALHQRRRSFRARLGPRRAGADGGLGFRLRDRADAARRRARNPCSAGRRWRRARSAARRGVSVLLPTTLSSTPVEGGRSSTRCCSPMCCRRCWPAAWRCGAARAAALVLARRRHCRRGARRRLRCPATARVLPRPAIDVGEGFTLSELGVDAAAPLRSPRCSSDRGALVAPGAVRVVRAERGLGVVGLACLDNPLLTGEPIAGGAAFNALSSPTPCPAALTAWLGRRLDARMRVAAILWFFAYVTLETRRASTARRSATRRRLRRRDLRLFGGVAGARPCAAGLRRVRGSRRRATPRRSSSSRRR